MNISGHAALVTGGGSGLGEAVARELARQGARVAVLDVNQATDGHAPRGCSPLLRGRWRRRRHRDALHGERGGLEPARLALFLVGEERLDEGREPLWHPGHAPRSEEPVEVAAEVPGATLEVIAGAGHTVQLEQPAALCAVIEALLDRLAG